MSADILRIPAIPPGLREAVPRATLIPFVGRIEGEVMITGELKSKVDSIWNTMWSGGISNPLSVIEQLTYLLFIKRLDELHTLKEAKAARTGKPIEYPVFTANQDKLRWSRFKEAAPEQMFETMRDGVFPFIKTLGQKGEADGDGGSTYSHHMKDALFMMPTARVLASVVDQLDGIDMADSDTKGDLYEYMLGKIATAGQNGQFRTPRHIIRLMVDMTAPTPKDVICDPACGTAGFLVAASEHLVEHHSDTIYKNAAARRHFNEGTFHGVVARFENWVYPGFPTIFRGLSEFFVGDLMGKALWKLVENAQRFPRRGGRVLCVHGPSASTGRSSVCDKMVPAGGDCELDRRRPRTAVDP